MDPARPSRAARVLLGVACVLLAIETWARVGSMHLFALGESGPDRIHVSQVGAALRIESDDSHVYAFECGFNREGSARILWPRVETWRINGRSQWRATYIPASFVWVIPYLLAAYVGRHELRRDRWPRYWTR